MTVIEALDDELLQDYANNFVGYGSYAGDYWLVGMEEGSSGLVSEISQRIKEWDNRGRNELEDLVDYHAATGMSHFFAPGARLQPTWRGLIQIVLSAEGQSLDREHARRFQREYLGRRNGNNALLELLPLPSPSTGHWLFPSYSKLPQLITRQTYMDYYAPRRADAIRQRVEEHKPKGVIFYSFNRWYRQWWQVIAGSALEFVEDGGVYVAENDTTTFVITKHPTAFHVSNAYFQRVGKIIAGRSG